jgi:hypothetical protein
MTCCPTCGQPIPPDIELQGPVRNRVYDFIRKNPRGVTRQQVADAVYRDDPNGGPDSATSVISATVWHINKKLRKHGVRIYGGGGGPGARYRLVNIL